MKVVARSSQSKRVETEGQAEEQCCKKYAVDRKKEREEDSVLTKGRKRHYSACCHKVTEIGEVEVDSSMRGIERKVKEQSEEGKKRRPNSNCPFLDPIHSTNLIPLLLRVSV